MIHKFVRLRNNILIQLKRLQDLHNSEERIAIYTKNDFITMITFANRFKNTKFTSIFYLWNIPKKNNLNDSYEDNELTDDEESKNVEEYQHSSTKQSNSLK